MKPKSKTPWQPRAVRGWQTWHDHDQPGNDCRVFPSPVPQDLEVYVVNAVDYRKLLRLAGIEKKRKKQA